MFYAYFVAYFWFCKVIKIFLALKNAVQWFQINPKFQQAQVCLIVDPFVINGNNLHLSKNL